MTYYLRRRDLLTAAETGDGEDMEDNDSNCLNDLSKF